MTKRIVLLICILGLIAGSISLLVPKKKPSDRFDEALAFADKAEAALREVDDSYTRHSITIDTPATYEDALGNTIILHCLQTMYFEADPNEVTDLNINAIEGIIDPETLQDRRNCKVGESSAVHGNRNGRAFLCWTLTPEISCVIEYTPEAVSEEEIFYMAEGVVLPESDSEN